MSLDLFKYFKKEADPQEVEQIENWAQESRDNLGYINQIRAIHNASENMHQYRAFDADTAYNKLAGHTAKRRSMFGTSMWYAAASLLIIASCTALFLQKEFKKTEQVFTTAEQFSTYTLKDGTLLTLDKNSTATVNGRNVELSGRAFFNVMKKSDKQKFTVIINKGTVTVLGTQFSVQSDDLVTEIAVSEGHVVYEYKNRKVDLLKGDAARLIDNDIVKSSNNTSTVFAWKNSELILNDIHLKEAINQINRYFHSNLILDAKLPDTDCKISTKFTTESFEDALKEITSLLQLKYHKKGNKIVITESKC